MPPVPWPRAVVAISAAAPRAENVTVSVPPPATHQRLVRPAVRVGVPARRVSRRAVAPRRQRDRPAEVSRARAGAQRRGVERLEPCAAPAALVGEPPATPEPPPFAPLCAAPVVPVSPFPPFAPSPPLGPPALGGASGRFVSTTAGRPTLPCSSTARTAT